MKTTVSVCVFILGSLLSTAAMASEHAAAPAAATCSPEKDAHCEEKAAHTDKKSKNKDWTHTRLQQVEAVLPQPTADKAFIARPTKVSLESPKFLADVSGTEVKLQWSKSENAKVYHLQVSKDAGFNNRSMYVANENGLTDTSFDLKNLEPGTKYFWRVAAQNNDLKEGYTKSNFTSSSFTTK